MVPEQGIHVTVTFLGLLRDQMGAPRLELRLPSRFSLGGPVAGAGA